MDGSHIFSDGYVDSVSSLASVARRIGTVVLMLLAAVPASACPVCNTGTGEQVRTGIFNAAFVPTLVELLAPLPVLAVCLLALRALIARTDARAGRTTR